jgi:hypothetical protein
MTLGKCRLLLRHFRDVTRTPARITDIMLSRMILGKCRLLQRDVTLIPSRITNIMLSRMTLGKCRLLQRDVTLIPSRITNIMLSRVTLGKCRLLQRWRHTNTLKNHGYNPVADDSGQVSSATTLFPWRDTNTCKNHGYNAVAEDSGQVSSASTWRHTNTLKNHGYNAVAVVSCAGSHVVLRTLHSLPTKNVKKVEKCQTFSDHTYPTVSSRRRERCVQSLVQIGSEMWIYMQVKYVKYNQKRTKTHYIFIHKIYNASK